MLAEEKIKMPIYEYMCQQCGQRHEAMQKFSDPPLSECPKCKGKLKKLISNTSFVLKGSGWYVTDYARKDQKSGSGNGKKKAAGEEKKAAAADKAAEAPKPETKTGGKEKTVPRTESRVKEKDRSE